MYERRVSTRLSAKKETETIEVVQETFKTIPARVNGDQNSPLTEIEEDAPEPPKKKRRRAKVVEPVVYDIPDVEKLSTTWKGALVQAYY